MLDSLPYEVPVEVIPEKTANQMKEMILMYNSMMMGK
jgi:hypothetical protein